MGYIVSLEEDQFGNIMNYTHNIKKLVHKLEKCLQSAEADYDEDDEVYEEEYTNNPNLRSQGEDMSPMNQTGYPMMNMRRGRGSNGKYISMRGKRRMPMTMPNDRYDF